MLHVMKSGALVLGSLAMVAATPSTSSAGFFPWLYDSLFGPTYYDPWYGGGGYAPYGYGGGYGPRAYQAAYYAGPAWDCGCEVGCAPCNGPCGPAGCPGGNCQWNAPAGQPTPLPDPNMNREDGTRPPRGTFETDPANGVYEPPTRGGTDRDSSGSRRRPANDGTLPRDPFVPRKPQPRDSSGSDTNRENETGNDPGGSSAPAGDTTSTFGTQKPILGTERIIQQKKPAEAAPVNEGDDADDADKIKIPDKSASKPIIEKHRMALRANFTAPNLVRTMVRPATEWSVAPTDARIARH